MTVNPGRRNKKNNNTYPVHTKFRHISSVLRDSEGNMCFSEVVDNKFYIRRTNIKDIKEITPNKKGQRGFRRKYIDKILRPNIVDENYKGDLFMYCIHEEDQQLREYTDFTTNKMYPHLRPNDKIYGLQPFCKKSKSEFVNSGPAGNKSRTEDQILEDLASRWRQALINSVYGGTPKIKYVEIHDKYEGCCFKCKIKIPIDKPNLKELDHTLPHSYFWPYTTENATLLCTKCNQEKNAAWPGNFYADEQLEKLSKLTNINLEMLSATEPQFNMEIIDALQSDRFDEIMNSCVSKFRCEKRINYFCNRVYKDAQKFKKSDDGTLKQVGDKLEKWSHLKMKTINKEG